MYAQCTVTSASLNGVEAVPVAVEVAISSGLPGFYIVGMADKAVQEARERVRSACKAAGFSMPAADKVVVNLAPGNLRKTGSGFDLPIALGVLAASGQLDRSQLAGKLFVGELSLEGSVREVAGTFAFAICASHMGFGLVSGAQKRVPVEGISQEHIGHLLDLRREDGLRAVREDELSEDASSALPDFREVAGHEVAKRALQIAAAGRHGVLMVGPPGSGKTMLAARVPSILPPLEGGERLEAALVHSVAGEDTSALLAGLRPFRSPHHSVTMPGLLGGGNPIRPGEVSLAHRGVLFLDELAEFKSHVLQGLRQPMESGFVCITRAAGTIKMPANFMLIAATNPCPCGYCGDEAKECTCTASQIARYQSKVGGPLMDRIDIQLDVQRIPTSEVLDAGSGTSSFDLREGVIRAREFSSWRASRKPGREGDSDGDLSLGASKGVSRPREVIDSCVLGDEAKRFAITMSECANMSARALVGALRVARTIADIGECEDVSVDHLAEAFGFRLSDGFGA